VSEKQEHGLDEAAPNCDDRSAGGILEYTDTPVAEATEQPSRSPTAATGHLETAEGHASDMVAVLLSIVPGLGHIYKGYRLIGVLLIFFGTPIALGLALLIATGTAGFGFFLLPVYWIAVMVHVWAIPDRIAPASDDEGEQY
jgi:hypothetical protein